MRETEERKFVRELALQAGYTIYSDRVRGSLQGDHLSISDRMALTGLLNLLPSRQNPADVVIDYKYDNHHQKYEAKLKHCFLDLQTDFALQQHFNQQ